tara:strand:+ start:241 stop:528 length:288 start_codon:yes stop_codon:yes gene_type:complete
MGNLHYLVIVFAVLLAEPSFAADIGSAEAGGRFDKANQAYLRGEFQEAISQYEDLLSEFRLVELASGQQGWLKQSGFGRFTQIQSLATTPSTKKP